MASTLVFMSLWAALCVGDPEHPSCRMRPGQCAELRGGQRLCATEPLIIVAEIV